MAQFWLTGGVIGLRLIYSICGFPFHHGPRDWLDGSDLLSPMSWRGNDRAEGETQRLTNGATWE